MNHIIQKAIEISARGKHSSSDLSLSERIDLARLFVIHAHDELAEQVFESIQNERPSARSFISTLADYPLFHRWIDEQLCLCRNTQSVQRSAFL